MPSPNDDERAFTIERWREGLRFKVRGYTFEFESALDALKVGLELADAARDVLAAREVERAEEERACE